MFIALTLLFQVFWCQDVSLVRGILISQIFALNSISFGVLIAIDLYNTP